MAATTRKGWGRSVTWATVVEAKAAAERSNEWLVAHGYAPELKGVYQTRSGRYSIRTGFRLILTVEPAAEVAS